MTAIRTHYDLLNVSRNAPIEVIRAAYKTLSQKYHPDKFQSEIDRQKANQIMLMLNNAYQVLSDQLQRFEYDDWLARQEAHPPISSLNEKRITVSVNYGNAASVVKSHGKSLLNFTQKKCVTFSNFIRELVIGMLRLLVPIAILGIIAAIVIPMIDKKSESANTTVAAPAMLTTGDTTQTATISPTTVAVENAEPVSSKPKKQVRKAPNGQPFPNRPTYVAGYPKLNTDGLSTITVENTQNTSDIFGKLIYLDNGQPEAVRHFFIPAGGGLILRDVTKGNYDIRYKDLDSGDIAKSESFEVQEIDDGTGTQFSNITMTLYKVANGNMQTTPISENEF